MKTQCKRNKSLQLGVTQTAISKRLHQMEKIQKLGSHPHVLTEHNLGQRMNTCLSLLARQQKKDFLWKTVMGDKKYIFYENPKRKKSWIDPGEPSTSTSKQNIHLKKIVLCICGHEGCALLRTPGNWSGGDCGTLQPTIEQTQR